MCACEIRFCPQGVGAGLTRESSAQRSQNLSAHRIRHTALAGLLRQKLYFAVTVKLRGSPNTS